MKLGFIALGKMGSAIARNLVIAGHSVTVWNRSPGPRAELQKIGANVADSLSQIAEADAIISMLSDDEAVDDIFVRQNLIGQMSKSTIHINMSTISIALAERLSRLHLDSGVRYVAAPVLGRPEAARKSQLHVLAAGEEDALLSVMPLLTEISQNVWTIGTVPAMANVAKISINLMIASAIEATAEAMTLSSSYGIKPTDFIEMATSSLFTIPVYQGYGKAMANSIFEPAGFEVQLGLKDVKLALQASESLMVPLPFASVLRDNLLDALAHGQANLDWASLSLVCGRRVGQDPIFTPSEDVPLSRAEFVDTLGRN